MIVIAALHGRSWVIIDHNSRTMFYLPDVTIEYPSHYSEVNNEEIARYLYEYTYLYDRNEIIRFEE